MTQKMCALCRECAEWLYHGCNSGCGSQKLYRTPDGRGDSTTWVCAIPEELEQMECGQLPIKPYWTPMGHKLLMLATGVDGEGRPSCGEPWHPHENRAPALNG